MRTNMCKSSHWSSELQLNWLKKKESDARDKPEAKLRQKWRWDSWSSVSEGIKKTSVIYDIVDLSLVEYIGKKELSGDGLIPELIVDEVDASEKASPWVELLQVNLLWKRSMTLWSHKLET